MKTTEADGRIYELTASDKVLPRLRDEIMKNGWDGIVYYGISKPVGRQRKEFVGLFYRSSKTGQFRKLI